MVTIQGNIDGKLVDLRVEADAESLIQMLWQLSEPGRLARLKAAFEALVAAANKLPG